MPGQHSAAISQKIMKTLGGAKIIGPLLIGLGQAIEIAPLRSSTSEILDLASVATDAKSRISEVDDLKGAISIAWPKPIKSGPIIFAPPNVFIIFWEIAALCWPGIINTFAFPTISEKG